MDVRLAPDIVRLGREGSYDVAVLFSRDQDLSEGTDAARAISAAQQRWIKIGSAFPVSLTSTNARGVSKTDWVHFDRAQHHRRLDRTDDRKGFRP